MDERSFLNVVRCYNELNIVVAERDAAISAAYEKMIAVRRRLRSKLVAYNENVDELQDADLSEELERIQTERRSYIDGVSLPADEAAEINTLIDAARSAVNKTAEALESLREAILAAKTDLAEASTLEREQLSDRTPARRLEDVARIYRVFTRNEVNA